MFVVKRGPALVLLPALLWICPSACWLYVLALQTRKRPRHLDLAFEFAPTTQEEDASGHLSHYPNRGGTGTFRSADVQDQASGLRPVHLEQEPVQARRSRFS